MNEEKFQQEKRKNEINGLYIFYSAAPHFDVAFNVVAPEYIFFFI